MADHPTWSPDGKRIAFHSRPEGQAEVYVINAEGGQPQRLTEEPAEDVRQAGHATALGSTSGQGAPVSTRYGRFPKVGEPRSR